jgi:hypothetical protein
MLAEMARLRLWHGGGAGAKICRNLTDFFSVVLSGYRKAAKTMYQLTNAETGEVVCPIGRKDLQFLSRHLEGDFIEDEEYLLTADELEQLEMYEIGESLDTALRRALDEEDSIPVVWSKA